MLPDPKREPARLSELRIGVAIPSNVPADLLRPIVLMGLRDPTMLETPMPQATINKHGDLGGSEDEVGPPAEVGERLSVHAVSQAALVDLRAYSDLGSRVTPAVALHDPGDGR